MSELVPGGNIPLPDGPVSVRVPGGFDVSALITDDGGKVGGDGDFVFYNQPDAPGARLRDDTLTVDPRRLRAGATRVTVAVSPAVPGTPLSGPPAPTLEVADAAGRTLARFTPPVPRRETVLLLAELYRRGDRWKLRALGQGYADGLAGLARDFGVEVVDDAQGSGPAAPEPAASDGFLGLVNSARAAAGAPPVSADARLASAARSHAGAMAAAGALSVETRDGVSVHQRVVLAGYAYLTVGEHLVSGPRTPAEFVGHCLRTERARRTLHDAAFTHAGWGYVTGGPAGDTYWTALWAVPLTPVGLGRATGEVVELTNRERARAGLPGLAADPRLTAAAQAHSADMVARDFYSHTDPDGGRPWDRAAAAGATRRTVGENIACGQRSPADVVEGWMNSPGHRANILGADFTHIGVGLAGGGRAGMYWTQLFGG
ncbi:CAP domain-containing protein [Streptomyces sp. NPDC127100]|uniref:CAP domain-containing protein n=1 Tax=Streptomyces sp. NPDC127100 TaxID=3347138 RepID=UPI00365BA5B4